MPGPSTLPPLHAFADQVAVIAGQIAESFTAQDDDFHPVMIGFPGDGSDFKVFALPGDLLSSQHGKDVLADEIMVPVIDAFGLRMISWTMSAWILSLEGKTEAEARAAVERAQLKGIANHPDRKEIVFINCLDALSYEPRMAEIRRTETAPPTLGPWSDPRQMYPEEEGHVEGRFHEPLQAALRDSSGVPNKGKIAKLRSRGIRMMGF